MKRHPIDTVSLVFGLIFLAIVLGLWFVDLFVEVDIPHFGWIAAVGSIVLGLLGVAASLRGGGRDTRDDTTRADATTANDITANDITAEKATSSAWTDPGTDTAADTAIRDTDSFRWARPIVRTGPRARIRDPGALRCASPRLLWPVPEGTGHGYASYADFLPVWKPDSGTEVRSSTMFGTLTALGEELFRPRVGAVAAGALVAELAVTRAQNTAWSSVRRRTRPYCRPPSTP